ncbi:DUF4240 domain-containing protein [Catenovulum sediminis]|uniref:DUF4240 domain-containing protein n=1 Tax=Catenovulum sediminis TaxID=1740262 RepID=A0ABV1RF36_9ALTE
MIDEFWNIIDMAKKNSDSVQHRPKELKRVLLQLPPKKIIDFNETYCLKLAESYRWDLWGAAYTISGGCSDDGFDYWCDFLISEGKEIYENALKNPDFLCKIDNIENTGLEEYRYAIADAYEELTGLTLPVSTINFPSEPLGKAWNEEDLPKLFPKLAKKYNNL